MTAIGDFVGDLGESAQIFSVGKPYSQIASGLAANGIQANVEATEPAASKPALVSKPGAPTPFI